MLTRRTSDSPSRTFQSSRTRIKTPTKEGYEVYKAYKEKVRKEAEERRLPAYMRSKFRTKNADGDAEQELMYASNGTNFSIDPATKNELQNDKNLTKFRDNSNEKQKASNDGSAKKFRANQ